MDLSLSCILAWLSRQQNLLDCIHLGPLLPHKGVRLFWGATAILDEVAQHKGCASPPASFAVHICLPPILCNVCKQKPLSNVLRPWAWATFSTILPRASLQGSTLVLPCACFKHKLMQTIRLNLDSLDRKVLLRADESILTIYEVSASMQVFSWRCIQEIDCGNVQVLKS